jgi:hypothetical protein
MIAYGVLFGCSSNWAYPVLGQCFLTTTEARLQFFSHDPGQTDTAISVKEYGHWVWIVDKTPRINYDRILLERVNHGFCYRASVSGGSVNLNKYKDTWMMDVDEPPFGTSPGQKIRYEMKNGESMFTRTGCYQYMAVGKPKSAVCEN